jgi:hypothetical protein
VAWYTGSHGSIGGDSYGQLTQTSDGSALRLASVQAKPDQRISDRPGHYFPHHVCVAKSAEFSRPFKTLGVP